MDGTQSGTLLLNYDKIYNNKIYESMNSLVLQAVASIQSDGVNHIDALKSDDPRKSTSWE